jgi:hypothetical protein
MIRNAPPEITSTLSNNEDFFKNDNYQLHASQVLIGSEVVWTWTFGPRIPSNCELGAALFYIAGIDRAIPEETATNMSPECNRNRAFDVTSVEIKRTDRTCKNSCQVAAHPCFERPTPGCDFSSTKSRSQARSARH